MLKFEFASANRIMFGYGEAERAIDQITALGKRALVVLGTNTPAVNHFVTKLTERGMILEIYRVTGEPCINMINEGVRISRAHRAEAIISLGGGSAIDSGKAIGALVTNHRSLEDYLEVIGLGLPLEESPLPLVAIPTTAGTGAEVTRNAVITAPEQHLKVSLRHPLLLPRLAVIDPEFTLSLPPSLTASTGLDALTQVIEPYLSLKANPLTDAFCRVGIQRAAQALPRVFKDGEDHAAREDMCLASLMGGLALANAKLGAVHGFAGSIGGMFPAPHGMICARLLPEVMEENYASVQTSKDQMKLTERFRDIASWLTGDPSADASAGITWLRRLVIGLQVPSLGTYGLKSADIPAIVIQSEKSSSMQGNPVKLSGSQMANILQRAL